MENRSKELFEWFYPDKCWHECKTFRQHWGVCVHCGGDLGDEYRNPDYTTEQGFFALLAGLRAKGLPVSMESTENDYWCHISNGDECKHAKTFSGAGNKLSEALCNAAIKAMDQESKDV